MCFFLLGQVNVRFFFRPKLFQFDSCYVSWHFESSRFSCFFFYSSIFNISCPTSLYFLNVLFISVIFFLSASPFLSLKMDETEPIPSSLNSSYLPTAFGNHQASEDEDSEDESSSTSLLPKHSPAPLPVRYSPEDSYYLVYIIFFLMGIGSLLPWNFFITAKHYWLYKLSNSTQRSSSDDQLPDISVSECDIVR